jgi:hypothetical protein
MSNQDNVTSSELMEAIRLKLIAMGYIVRSSVNNLSLWYATNDTRGELHAVIFEDQRIRVNDINGRHESQRRQIETEVRECLKN